jgi:hypothetical protein
MNDETWKNLERDRNAAREAEERYERQRAQDVSRLTPTQQRLRDKWDADYLRDPGRELTNEEYQQRRIEWGLERDDSLADRYPELTFIVIVLAIAAIFTAFVVVTL